MSTGRPLDPRDFDAAKDRARERGHGRKRAPETEAMLALEAGQAIALPHTVKHYESGACRLAINLQKVARRHGRQVETLHMERELWVKRVK